MSVPRPCLEKGCHRFAYRESRCRPCYLAAQMERNARPERAIYRDPAYRTAVLYGPCVDCGTWDDLTKDHVRSVADGGTNEMGNLRVLCRSCNSRKGGRSDV